MRRGNGLGAEKSREGVSGKARVDINARYANGGQTTLTSVGCTGRIGGKMRKSTGSGFRGADTVLNWPARNIHSSHLCHDVHRLPS